MVSDAGADPDFTFGDLGAAIRKSRNDFGVEIRIDTSRVRPVDGRSPRHCALGTIHYPSDEPGATPGTVLYLKASLTGDEPEDILNYASQSASFPHEPTADQWFGESQFESYRKLGEHVVLATFAGAGAPPATLSDEDLAVELQRAWYPSSTASQKAFTRHAAALDTLYERLRRDDDLAFLRPQLYPHWRKVATSLDLAGAARGDLPTTLTELDHGLYFGSTLLQLVENVYLDLDLETEHDHPDNRGWMNLFHTWSGSAMVRLTWSVTAGTFGARFQTWAERRLRLDLGRVVVAEHPPDHRPSELAATERSVLARLRDRSGRDGDRLFVFALEVADGEAAAESAVTLPFGFAVTAGQRFVYFRIQRQVRRMGLARRALEALLASQPIDLVPEVAPDDGVTSPEERRRFARLVRSVRFGLASRDREGKP